ncbi:MAG: hypothetical protein M3Y57_18965 [Acidobacteriota bacterium]|nr:hypothetical protein [Acidobacteriota bacterium]
MSESFDIEQTLTYDTFGHLAAEYDTGGSLISPCGTRDLFTDSLGSVWPLHASEVNT